MVLIIPFYPTMSKRGVFMLTIENTANIVPTNIEIDLYIPLRVKWENHLPIKNSIYWRTGNFKDSLLELGIYKENRQISSLTLTSVKKVYFQSSPSPKQLPVKEGVPVIRYHHLFDQKFTIDHPIILMFSLTVKV